MSKEALSQLGPVLRISDHAYLSLDFSPLLVNDAYFHLLRRTCSWHAFSVFQACPPVCVTGSGCPVSVPRYTSARHVFSMLHKRKELTGQQLVSDVFHSLSPALYSGGELRRWVLGLLLLGAKKAGGVDQERATRENS